MRRAALVRGISALGVISLTACSPRAAAMRVAERFRGCVDTAVPSATGVHVIRGRFGSRHLAGPVRYAIVVPDGPPPADVAYVLPGRGSDADAALALGIDGFLADHLRNGGSRFAVAIVDAGESYFHPRANGEDRLKMTTAEFPAVVRRALGVHRVREAMLGYSMGGHGALLAVERDPQRFRAVAVAGPAIFPSYEDERRSVGDAFDSAADFARYDVIAGARALRGTPVFIAVGRRDPFLPAIRRFAAAIPNVVLDVRPGCHDDGSWRVATAPMLTFVGRVFARAHETSAR